MKKNTTNKFLAFLLCLSLGLFISMGNVDRAEAIPLLDNFTLDLSSLGYGTFTNIDRLSVEGQSQVSQTFLTPGQMNVGDPFEEFSQLNTLTYFTEPGAPANQQSFNLGTAGMYIYATGLKGKISQVDNPTNPTNSRFEYTFDPGVGTISWYLDDTGSGFDPTDGPGTLLASLELTSGNGIGNPGFLSASGYPNGTTSLQALMIFALPGVFKDENGVDLMDYPAAWQFYNTNNEVVEIAFANDGTGFEAIIDNGGQNRPGVVPEPASMLLMGTGLLGLSLVGRKKYLKKG